jgi:hypothetical protein
MRMSMFKYRAMLMSMLIAFLYFHPGTGLRSRGRTRWSLDTLYLYRGGLDTLFYRKQSVT